MKKFLVFTGVGDVSDQYLSWASTKSDLYDRAINYFGEKNYQTVLDLNCEYSFNNKGMIWNNFVANYELFKDYEYVLVVDSDLELNPTHIEETFTIAKYRNWSQCGWSHTENSKSININVYKQVPKGRWRKTNFIEMHFMMLRQDLCKLAVDFWNLHNIEWSTGIDILMTHLAYKNDMMPFYIFDKYSIYNPWPTDKNNVILNEIVDLHNVRFDKRIAQLNNILKNDTWYSDIFNIPKEIKTW